MYRHGRMLLVRSSHYRTRHVTSGLSLRTRVFGVCRASTSRRNLASLSCHLQLHPFKTTTINFEEQTKPVLRFYALV